MDRLKHKKAVIFDMDGTLADSIPFHKEAWLTFLSNHGVNLAPEDFQAQNHGNIDEMIRRFFGDGIPDEQMKSLGQEKEQTYRDLYKDYLEEIKGLTSFLQKLKVSGYGISLATMGDAPNIEFILNGLGIKDYFQPITGGHEVVRGKPDAEIFHIALDKLKLKKEDCIVIEDSLGGVIASLQAGIDVIGITTAHPSDELIKNGCIFTINDYRDFK
ncbi:MAG: HAD family hydrolase [Mangrovibacterium sp.]